ncbi:MAG: hypothetical protein QNJ16_03660 [Rhodobacter sp.]|nr:hypothetical protein [Rhodobacter sp.]
MVRIVGGVIRVFGDQYGQLVVAIEWADAQTRRASGAITPFNLAEKRLTAGGQGLPVMISQGTFECAVDRDHLIDSSPSHRIDAKAHMAQGRPVCEDNST